MKNTVKNNSARLRIGRVNPLFLGGRISRGYQITKTDVTYELDILQAYIIPQNLQNTGSYSSKTHKIAFALSCSLIFRKT